MPTFVSQVRDDSFTFESDVQQIFDALPMAQKKLKWIEGTKQRFKGYTYFSEHPQEMLDWYNNF